MANYPGISQDAGQEEIAEGLGQLLGQRGDKLNRAITFRDLLEKGILQWSDIASADNGDPETGTEPTTPPPDSSIPPAPTGLEANGAFETVILSWDDPYAAYNNHAVTEIWRNDKDNLANAILVGGVDGRVFSDTVGSGTTHYYWIRWVSRDDVKGPFNSAEGTRADTAYNVDYLRDQLVGAIQSSELHGSLRSTITTTIEQQDEPEAKPDGSSLVAGDLWRQTDSSGGLVQEYIYTGSEWIESGVAAQAYVNQQITEQVGVCRNANGDILTGYNARGACESAGYTWDDTASLAQNINTVTTKVNNNQATVLVQQNSINGLEASYTVKIDNNGRVAGYGLASERNDEGGIESYFEVNADHFSVSTPDAYGVTPFVIGEVDGYTVVTISNAAIADASITDAKIDTLNAEKLTTPYGTLAEAVIGRADITNAMIANVIQSNNYWPGYRGWRIDKRGDAEFQEGTFRGRVVAESGDISKALNLRGDPVTNDGWHQWYNVYIPKYSAWSKSKTFGNPSHKHTLYGFVTFTGKWDADDTFEPGDGIYYGFRIEDGRGGYDDYGDGVYGDKFGGAGTMSPFITATFPVVYGIPPGSSITATVKYQKRDDSLTVWRFMSFTFTAGSQEDFYHP